MSDTPRTDAESNRIGESGIDWHYSATRMATFACQLERELNAVKTMIVPSRTVSIMPVECQRAVHTEIENIRKNIEAMNK